MKGTLPIPWWKSDRDYYSHNDPRREAHVRAIDTQNRINARICASAGDGSYSVVIHRKEVP